MEARLVFRTSLDTKAWFFGASTGTFRPAALKSGLPASTLERNFGKPCGTLPLYKYQACSRLFEFARPR